MINGIIAVIAGMFIGGLIDSPRSGFSGVLWGGSFGYALFAIFHLRQRLDGLQQDVSELRRRYREAVPPTPARAPAPSAVIIFGVGPS
jgi:hypothetical protein